MSQHPHQYATLTLAYDGPVATVTLNRPDKRNAISHQLIEELHHALHEVLKAPAHILILTGAGAAFCAGMDLDDLREITRLTEEENLADSGRMAHMFRTLFDFPKVTIAAVNGAAIAGGCGLATLCDFTLAAANSKFGYTEVRIGFVPAIVSTFLMRQVGEKQARDLLLTGRIIDAEEAHRIGLVNEVVAPENLLVRARELADTLSPTARRLCWLRNGCSKRILTWTSTARSRRRSTRMRVFAQPMTFGKALAPFWRSVNRIGQGGRL